MHCGYLSLRHNWNTNCWNLSLMITGTSRTLSRTNTARKFFLLPLFLSPRLTGEEASPLAPRMGLSRSERLVSPHPAVKIPLPTAPLGFVSAGPPPQTDIFLGRGEGFKTKPYLYQCKSGDTIPLEKTGSLFAIRLWIPKGFRRQC